MMHDRTINTECETPLPESSDFARSVRQITTDPLASIEQHVDANAMARKLGLTAKFIRDEMTSGAIAYIRCGRRRLIPVSAVEAYVAARAVGNHPARKPTQQTVIGFPPARRRTA